MARKPTDYGSMFAKRLADTGANCWLLNTGWSGGSYGVGERMSLSSTRAMLNAALNGELDNAEFRIDETFGLEVPLSIDGVDDVILNPQQTWADKDAYEVTANKLAKLFDNNFIKLGLENSEYAAGSPSKKD